MACPVCFGGDDPVVRESLNAGIGVLLGVTGIVLGCFARFFLTLAKRSKEAAHLVGGQEVRLTAVAETSAIEKPDTTYDGMVH